MARTQLTDLHQDQTIDQQAMQDATGGYFTNPSWALRQQTMLTRRYTTSTYSTSRYTVNPYSTARYMVNPYSTARYTTFSRPMYRF